MYAMDIELVDTETRLRDLAVGWCGCDWVAVDTEFMRFETYYPQLCLVQVHSAFGTAGIDTLCIENLDALRALFESDSIPKIMHACRQDLEALRQCAGFTFQAVFDTQIAAAFCGYGDSVGYAGLVRDLCGVELEKDQTLTDWSRRPLTAKQLEYAKNDVIHLNDLRIELEGRIRESGKGQWFREECLDASAMADLVVEPEDAWRRFSHMDFPDGARGVARELVLWRERTAQRLNRPRQWILSNRALMELCVRRPKNAAQLARVRSLGKREARISGKAILSIFSKFRTPSGNGSRASAERPDREFRQSVKAAMGILGEAAGQRGISQGLLASRKDVESVIRGETDSKVLKGWRYEVIGKALRDRFC